MVKIIKRRENKYILLDDYAANRQFSYKYIQIHANIYIYIRYACFALLHICLYLYLIVDLDKIQDFLYEL